MKKTRWIASLAVAVALLMAMTACGNLGGGAGDSDKPEQEEPPQEITSTESGIVFSFPASWKGLELNDSASVEMGNEGKEQYFAVIEDDVVNFTEDMTIQEYGDIIFENIQGAVTEAEPGAWTDVTVGDGIPARQIVLKGVAERIKVAYLITVFKGDKAFYQALAWSLQSKYDDAVPVFNEILASAKLPA